MNLEDALQDAPTPAPQATSGSFTVDGPLTVSTSLSLTDSEVHFSSPEACLTLQGPGPFRFLRTRFVHGQSEAPILLKGEDAQLWFEECHFQGANGGTEEQLACAVELSGRGEARFADCHFEDNDLHLSASGDSVLSVVSCHLLQARADAIRCAGKARVTVRDCELVESGWTALVAADDCTVDVGSTRLSGNGCHGLSAGGNARVLSSDNSFTGNRQHGVFLHGHAALVSKEDHLAANDLCGYDGTDFSQGVLHESEAYGNESHGLQLRGDANCLLTSCRMGDNTGSGLALFDQAALTAHQLVAEANELNGVQCTGSGRLVLSGSEILGNLSSGLACFGESRATLESSTLGGSQGYGAQVSESCRFSMADCQLRDNRKGGLLLANQASAWVNACTLSDNGLHGVAVSDSATLTLLESTLRGNARDGVILLGQGASQVLRNELHSNGRHGVFAAITSKPMIDDNSIRDNAGEQLLVESVVVRAPSLLSIESVPSLEEPAGVTLTAEGGATMHLPFQPKPIEESMLLALMRHGRLSEAALGKAAKSRRVGGAMENLIDRLNKAGLPVLRHDGEGPEGNVYALKLDTTRTRQAPGLRNKLGASAPPLAAGGGSPA